jgi:hypothetical protein
MTKHILAALPLLVTAASAHADAGAAMEGATISGMMLIGVAAAASLWFSMHERRRESGRQPISLIAKTRRDR